MPTTYTPLRYPGGKTKLYKEILPYLSSVQDSNITYVEPFAGGAGLALKLLFCNHVNSIILNDIDENIYSFWNACINDTELLCQMIDQTTVSIQEWERQKEILNKPHDISSVERAFAFLFMNRCNRSGIITGGPIGGMKQESNYKIDARFNKTTLINKIKAIGDYRNSIKVYCMDAKDFIIDVCENLPVSSSFINIDPPYVNKGPILYQNSFTKADHVELSKVIKQLKQKWVVTYDADLLIKELYSCYPITDIQLGYSAGSQRRVGHEFLIASLN